MEAVVTVVFHPSSDHKETFERLLRELSDFIRSEPPEGMDAMSILRGGGHVLVQAKWRDAEQQRSFRASKMGSRIFLAMSQCAVQPPVTYTSSKDHALSFTRESSPDI